MSQTRGRESTPDIRLYCMSGGRLTFDQSVFTHMQGMGTLVEVPIPMRVTGGLRRRADPTAFRGYSVPGEGVDPS